MDFAEINNVNVPVQYLADLCGVDKRTIQLWAQNEELPRTERGEYPLVKALLWIIDKYKRDLDEMGKNTPLQQAKLAYQLEMNKEKIIKVKKMEGSVVDAGLLKAAWVLEMRNISRNMDALVPVIARITGADVAQMQLIRKEVEAMRNVITTTDLDLSNEIEKQLETEVKILEESEEENG